MLHCRFIANEIVAEASLLILDLFHIHFKQFSNLIIIIIISTSKLSFDCFS